MLLSSCAGSCSCTRPSLRTTPKLCQHAYSNKISRPQQRPSRNIKAAVFDKLQGFFNSPGDPEDEDQGAEMARIDPESRGGVGGTSEEVFGPLAVLLIGFLPPDLEGFQTLMTEMEAHMVKVVPATQAMMAGTLQQALETDSPQYEQPPLGQRRAVILSGMYGNELVDLIASYRDAGLPPCVFAAAVPNNWQRNVQELVDAIWKDHSTMMSKLQEQQALDSSSPASEDK